MPPSVINQVRPETFEVGKNCVSTVLTSTVIIVVTRHTTGLQVIREAEKKNTLFTFVKVITSLFVYFSKLEEEGRAICRTVDKCWNGSE